MPQHLSFSIKYFLIVLVFSKANTRWVKSTYTVFIHLAVCHTTGPKPLPKRSLHIVRSRASSFKWEYPLLTLRSSNSFLRLLPCLPVTSIPPCIFPSITRCRRQFLRKIWPIQFAFRLRKYIPEYQDHSCLYFICAQFYRPLPPSGILFAVYKYHIKCYTGYRTWTYSVEWQPCELLWTR